MPQLTVSGHDIERNNVVADQAVLSPQPSQATTQREPGNAGVRKGPARHGQAKSLDLSVKIDPLGAGLGPGCLGTWVNANRLHSRKVHDQTVIADGVALDVVSTPAD